MRMSASFEAKALDSLRDQKLRITKPRRWVIQLLATADKPLNAYEIKDRLDAQQQSIDTVSVYRILQCLEEQGLVHKLQSSGKVVACHHDDGEHTHCNHHKAHTLLVCQQCGTTKEVVLPMLDSLVQELKETQDFSLNLAQQPIELRGLCSTCPGL